MQLTDKLFGILWFVSAFLVEKSAEDKIRPAVILPFLSCEHVFGILNGIKIHLKTRKKEHPAGIKQFKIMCGLICRHSQTLP